MHERDAVCRKELLCFPREVSMFRKQNERETEKTEGGWRVRVCVGGADGTNCLLLAAASSGRTGASAKRLWGLLTALRMLVGWPCLPSRTPKAFTGLVLSSIEGEKTSTYSLPHRPAAEGGSPACAQGVSDLRGPEPTNQVLNSKRPGSRLSNQKDSPLLLQSS